MPVYGYLMKVCNKDRELCIVSNGEKALGAMGWNQEKKNKID